MKKVEEHTINYGHFDSNEKVHFHRISITMIMAINTVDSLGMSMTQFCCAWMQ
jgi:hypothetical protein